MSTKQSGQQKATTVSRGKRKLGGSDVPKEDPQAQLSGDSIEADVERLRMALKTPVSDDTLDALEGEIDKLNDTSNLGEKVRLHTKLESQTKLLEDEIDLMIDMMDDLDFDKAYESIKTDKNKTDTTDVTDDIVNLDKLMNSLKQEDVMQIKIMYVQKMLNHIARCRALCDQSKLIVSKCN